MNNLIIYCHPNPKSFNHALMETAKSALQEDGHPVHCRDLYALGFHPVLEASDFEMFQSGSVPEDIEIEQNEIRWANRLIVIHPIWWTGSPARMKGYIDRVFSIGFAYKYEAGEPVGLLNGKEVLIVNTTGSPNEPYQKLGMHDSIRQTNDVGIFQFCGMRVVDHLFFGAVPQIDDQMRRGYLKELEKRIKQLSNPSYNV